VTSAPYRTVTRRLRAFAEDSRQQQISAGGVCPSRDADHPGRP